MIQPVPFANANCLSRQLQAPSFSRLLLAIGIEFLANAHVMGTSLDARRVATKGRTAMKLILQRSQSAGMMGVGKVKFGLDARAELTSDESEYVKKYKMGDEVLYFQEKVGVSGIESMGMMAQLSRSIAARALNVKITVDDLVRGKHIECKDIIEMRAAEEQIKEACQTFKQVLESAAQFGGEEVIQI